jgi:hypothetical protein
MIQISICSRTAMIPSNYSIEPQLICALCSAAEPPNADEPSVSLATNSFVDDVIYVVIIAALVALFALCAIAVCYQRRRAFLSACVFVRNPMVLILGQAYYSDDRSAREYVGYLSDLDGIDVDVRNLVTLFRSLNYRIFPRDATCDALRYPRCEWTKDELIALFTEMAAELEASIERGGRDAFDGLFVSISGHGYKGAVITADHKLLTKTEIHRCSARRAMCARGRHRAFSFRIRRECVKRKDDSFKMKSRLG